MTKAAAIAALVILPIASAQAAGPFQVRRATSGQGVCTSAPVATVATSPYDGELSVMADPASYFYAVYDAGGNALRISVQKNPVTHAIRIGFDDGLATSAPVNAASSSVNVAPATVQANGLQAAVITIVPRDASGVMLGTGLSLSIDGSLLWPAQLSGPIADMGDGSYRAMAVASVAGTGTVRASVEGVALASLPTITATAVDPNASMRDLAILQLQSLIGPGGPLANLQAQAGASSPQASAIAAAIARANQALATLANDDPSRDDNVLKIDFDAILHELLDVLAAPGALAGLDVRDAMDDLLGIARLIAQWHIDEASAVCGVCDGSGNPRKLCDAINAMAEADAMRSAVSPNWGVVADMYAWAVERALQALQLC